MRAVSLVDGLPSGPGSKIPIFLPKQKEMISLSLYEHFIKKEIEFRQRWQR
jgi:hypothetical protein